jgi:hypothetical protein
MPRDCPRACHRPRARRSLAGQAHASSATIPFSLRDRDQFLRAQGLQQTAEIARIKPKLAAERPDVGAIGADLEKEPRLRQRAAPPQVIDFERADALSHKPIETPYALQLAFVHSLTLVRYLPISSATRTVRPLRLGRPDRNAAKLADTPDRRAPICDWRDSWAAKETIAARRQTALVSIQCNQRAPSLPCFA